MADTDDTRAQPGGVFTTSTEMVWTTSFRFSMIALTERVDRHRIYTWAEEISAGERSSS